MNFFNIVPVNGYPIDQTKSAIPYEEMADFVYVRNLVRNDDLDTCVLDFLAQSVRNT